jgi:hypothetical protein
MAVPLGLMPKARTKKHLAVLGNNSGMSVVNVRSISRRIPCNSSCLNCALQESGRTLFEAAIGPTTPSLGDSLMGLGTESTMPADDIKADVVLEWD